MGGVEEAEHVELDHAAPLLHRGVHDGPEQHDPGVVDHGVEAAELEDGSLHHGPGGSLVGDVGLHHQHVGIVADPLDDLLQPVTAAGGDG